MPFEIIHNNITQMQTDAIVNAANEKLRAGGGVCGAIFRAAGAQELQAACDAIGGCAAGQAVITPGFGLAVGYIIHVVGPVWRGGGQGEEALLRACYRNALTLARENGLASVAFPLISAGSYGYPVQEALRVAVSEIRAFLQEHEMEVYLVLLDPQVFSLSQDRYASIHSYISRHYVRPAAAKARAMPKPAMPAFAEVECYSDNIGTLPSEEEMEAPALDFLQRRLADVVEQLDETFSQMLLRLIDEKGYTDTEVYKRANIDRKLFSKIRSNAEYKPSKHTAVALAVALRLNLDETKDLLLRAGYALSRSSKGDVIVEYFLSEEIWDIYEINEALFAFGQALLGGAVK